MNEEQLQRVLYRLAVAINEGTWGPDWISETYDEIDKILDNPRVDKPSKQDA